MVKFSIILPTYNRAHRIGKAIESIINQTHQNWELIIVDDASTDHTFERVSQFSDERIRYLRNDQNQERCISRNRGIKESKGDYICFLDSDDYHLPNHLSMLHDFIVSRNFPKALIFTNAWDETETGIRTERNCPNLNDFDYYTYFLRYTVNPQRWCVHRTIFDVIQFDPKITICEDMDTSLRIVEKGFPIFQLQERTTVYVAADDSFTHGDSKKWEKELHFLKKIVSKKELKSHLPRKEINRLFSMCYFHLTQKSCAANLKSETLLFSIKSFILCPKGYNGKTNKILFVCFLYALPILSIFIKLFKRK